MEQKFLIGCRLVLDTNCLVSALLFSHGKLGRYRNLWQTGEITPITCESALAELTRVLGYPKFKLDRARIAMLLRDLLPFVEHHDFVNTSSEIMGLRDPADGVFIRLADAARADFLISGDTHLLELGKTMSAIPILSPADFLRLF